MLVQLREHGLKDRVNERFVLGIEWAIFLKQSVKEWPSHAETCTDNTGVIVVQSRQDNALDYSGLLEEASTRARLSVLKQSPHDSQRI